MKNTMIILMLLLPVLSCQNTNPNVTVSSTPSTIKTSASVLPNISSSSSTISLPSIVPTPSPSPTVPDLAKLVYPNDYNQMEYHDSKSLPPLSDDILNNPKNQLERGGCVFDRNSNRIPNADITIKSLDKNQFSFFKSIITNKDGCFSFKIPDYGLFINVFVTKKGFTTRVKSELPGQIYDGSYSFGLPKEILNINQYDIAKSLLLTINNEPEITNIIINDQEVRRFDYNKYLYLPQYKLYDDIYSKPNVINKNTGLSRFKLKNTENIKITLKFNKAINKESVEKNIKIESLDKKETYNYLTYKAKFEWKDDISVIFSVPVNQNINDTKYKLSFEQAFLDYQGNKAYPSMYIALQPDDSDSNPTELSENIVFTVAGNK